MHSRGQTIIGALPAKHRRTVADADLATVCSGCITDRFVACTNDRAEHRRAVADADLAVVCSGSIKGHLVACTGDGAEHRRAVADADLAVVLGGGVTDDFVPQLNIGHRYISFDGSHFLTAFIKGKTL